MRIIRKKKRSRAGAPVFTGWEEEVNLARGWEEVHSDRSETERNIPEAKWRNCSKESGVINSQVLLLNQVRKTRELTTGFSNVEILGKKEAQETWMNVWLEWVQDRLWTEDVNTGSTEWCQEILFWRGTEKGISQWRGRQQRSKVHCRTDGR